MGQYLAPDVYVDDNGGIWAYGRNGRAALGGFWDAGGGWEKISQIAAPIAGGVAMWLANKNAKNAPSSSYVPPAGGVQVGASSGGLFGSIDTTTLLLIGGALLLFLSRPGGK
jgi:hypothetical protein